MTKIHERGAGSGERGTNQWLGSFGGIVLLSLVTCYVSRVAAAAELPSVFRGVVVADSPLGVRVVSVEPVSQAELSDMRPEDIIVRIGSQDVRSIDDFAVLSDRLRGRTKTTTVLVFRNGAPLELTLQLYSYPLLHRWGIQFLPDDELRFAQPKTALEYWRRLGRGFGHAERPEEALNAYLNGLHHVPEDVETALTAAVLLAQISRMRLEQGALPEGFSALQDSLTITQRLFDSPLSDEQLTAIKQELQATLQTIRATARRRIPAPP